MSASFATSGDAIFAILLGGARVFFGPLVGATILQALLAITTAYTGHTSLALGLVILLIVLGLGRGPMDYVYEWWSERSQSRQQRIMKSAADGAANRAAARKRHDPGVSDAARP